MAIRAWRDSDSADLGNEGIVPWVMCLLFRLIAQTACTAGNANPCGVINGTPHGFFFDNEELLADRQQNSALGLIALSSHYKSAKSRPPDLRWRNRN